MNIDVDPIRDPGNAPAGTGPARLSLRGITRRYGTVLANDTIDLDVGPGEIHALLGENGAGKSTLVKMVYGVTRPDAGTIAWEGRPVTIDSPSAARALGIGMVFQHFTLFDSLTVAENLALGGGLAGVRGRRSLGSAVRLLAERYGLHLDPDRHVHHLSVGERQRVEIVRALLLDPRLIIMDEPTAVLTPQEADGLFATLRALAASGVSILFISHKLDEVRGLCSVATILRAGRVVARCDPREQDDRSLATMMVGRNPPVPRRVAFPAATHPRLPRLVVDRLSQRRNDPFGVDLRDVSLTLHAGEIVGIAGVAGNGQRELVDAIGGQSPAPRPDAIRIGGVPAGRLGPAGRRKLGLAIVPEERIGTGSVPELDLAANALLTGHGAGLVRRGLVDRSASRARAQAIIDRFGVVATGPDQPAASLSGGNLQKFVIGREIGLAPAVLVAAHPTWGVDVGAAAAIVQALSDLARDGAAVLLISEDLDELFEVCDRVAALCGGRLSDALPVDGLDRAVVGAWMAGRFDVAPEDDGAGPA